MMTIGQLIDQLDAIADEYGSDIEVRLATQPSWPFEYTIADEVVVNHDAMFNAGFDAVMDGSVEEYDTNDIDEVQPIAYIGEAGQVGYLAGVIRDAMWH